MVHTAVIPAAGFGTRFLPASKAIPKELVTVVDKPAIQWAVEEAVAAGCSRVIVVVSRSKNAVQDHFDRFPDLELALQKPGKEKALDDLKRVHHLAEMVYVHQTEQLGLGHAVAAARSVVGDEPFAVLLPDDVMSTRSTLLKEMVALTKRTGVSTVSLKRVPLEQIQHYGSAIIEESSDANQPKVLGMVEKPKPEEAPSDLAVLGRYVLTPSVFDAMDGMEKGAGGEYQLTDGIAALCKGEGVYGQVFTQGRYDTGNFLDWMTANVALGLEHDQLGLEFRLRIEAILRGEKL